MGPDFDLGHILGENFIFPNLGSAVISLKPYMAFTGKAQWRLNK